MNRKILFFVFGLMLSNSISIGQRLDMRFYDPLESLDQELTSDFVSDVVQDTLGYIWVGSRDGLNAYNGAEIIHYLNDPEDSNSLVNNNVLDLFVDNSGRLWVATVGGLSLYNPMKDNFITIADENRYIGLKSPNISNVTQDDDNNIFVASESGVFKYDEEKQKFEIVTKLKKGEIVELEFDKNNNLWIAGAQGGGLNYYNFDTKELTLFSSDRGTSHPGSDDIRALEFYHDKLWLATYGNGIVSLDPITKEFTQYEPDNSEYGNFASFVYSDNNDRLWTCDLTGLKLYDEQLDTFYGYYAEETESNNLKQNASGIFQDRQGNYWAYHSPGGIGLRIVPRGIQTYNTNPEWFWHTSESNITSVGIDKQGNWWIGNQHNGLDIFEWAEGKIITYHHHSAIPHSLGKGTTFATYKDSEDKMWIGSNLGGLQYFNASDSNFYSYVNDPQDPKSIANNDVRWITEDSNGDLWLVVHGKGIDRFDKEIGAFFHYNSASHKLSNDWTFQVFIDSKDNIWVATAWGLNKMTMGEEKFQNYFNDAADETSILSNEVNHITEDSNGQIWISTSKGVCKYNSEHDNFIRANFELKSKFVCAIQEGSKGNLWISTKKGLSMYSPKEDLVLNFGSLDGVQEGEFNRSVAFTDPNENTIFFGGVEGLNYFVPEQLFFNNEASKVAISKIKLFDDEVIPGDETGILSEDVLFTNHISLKHSQNKIALEFVSLNFINAGKNTFKYKLAGFDEEWINAGSKREAVYTNLDPGDYEFKVMAANNDKVWTEKNASLKISVLPPWWMTWWFRVLVTLTVLLIFVLIFYYRTAKLRSQKILLERMVEDRTKKLNENNTLLKQQTQDLNEINTLLEERTLKVEEQSTILRKQTNDLKQKNSELEELNVTKDKLFSIVAHDLKNPFQAILSLSDMFFSKFDHLSDKDKKQIATYINTSGKTVYNLLENLLNWARSQSNQIKYKPTDFNIYGLVHETIKLLRKLADDKNIIINIQDKEEILVRGDKDMLNTTLRNLLSNAIKFTHKNGEINISIVEKENFAEVSITDNGIGMEKEVLNRLFSIDKGSSRQGTDGEKGSALGLVLCKDFIERNGGKITVESKERKGSTFRFTIPLSSVKAAN